ncbi:MAG: sterol carrier family protein [Propionibacteriaceae bacterium]|jgi:hypothetical protein|nr:sterol carrier family protein [Propionibacteriaceae bacterium]
MGSTIPSVTTKDQDIATQVRQLAADLARTHRGKAVEIRVPPLVAFQIGVESVSTIHRRGTPGHVVEMDPETFLALGAGTLSWEDAVADHLVNVCGVHGDVSQIFAQAPEQQR